MAHGDFPNNSIVLNPNAGMSPEFTTSIHPAFNIADVITLERPVTEDQVIDTIATLVNPIVKEWNERHPQHALSVTIRHANIPMPCNRLTDRDG